MAQIEGWLWTRLQEDADILAAIGAEKVYPIQAPQGTTEPFITFTRTNTRRDYTTRHNDGKPIVSFDVNCWDTDYARLKTWDDLVRIALDGYKQDADGFVVRAAFIQDQLDVILPADPGAEIALYGTKFVLEVCHTETVVIY